MMQNFHALKERFSHLELSILSLSSVLKDNETKRLDSEYFKKEYLENEELLKGFECKTLEQLSTKITNGHTPYGENLLENEVKFITAEFVDDFIIDEVKKFISFKSHSNYLKRSILNDGDIIFSIKGKIGNAVPIFDIQEPLNINQDIAKISLKKEINHFYVSAFLNSKYGKKQTEAEATGQINPFVALGVLKKIKIPLFPENFQKDIEILVKDAHQKLEQSKSLYKEAEALLYSELGLNVLLQTKPSHCHTKLPCSHTKHCEVSTNKSDNGYFNEYKAQFSHLNFSILPLSQSLQKTGRLDSEYYQSKYEDIERVIKNYKGGFCRLKVDEIKDDNFIPKAEEKYCYIELANISSFGNTSEPLFDLGKNLPTRARRKVKIGDFIMSSVEGSLQSCALITPEFDNCLVSTGFYVINSHQINSETLLVLFKSDFFQNYLKKFTSGTILTAISKEELQNLLIPILDLNTQTQIADKLKLSFALKKEAKALLEKAKNKVESAIENKNF